MHLPFRKAPLLIVVLLAVAGCGSDEASGPNAPVTQHTNGKPDASSDTGAKSDAAQAEAALETSAEATIDSQPLIDSVAPSDVMVDSTAPLDASEDKGPDVHSCQPTVEKDCSQGSGTGTGDQCADGSSCFLKTVQNAIKGVIAANPTWFNNDNPNNCPMILNLDGFLDAVVADIAGHDLCVIRDPNAPGEEITVKHDNAFSENFDIVASTGCARYGDPIYTGYCAPAWW